MVAQTATKRKRERLPLPPSYTGPTPISWREACAILGCGDKSLYKMAEAGTIPCHRIGLRGWRFYREPLELWKRQQLAHGLEPRP